MYVWEPDRDVARYPFLVFRISADRRIPRPYGEI